jgi:hypothetical protein
MLATDAVRHGTNDLHERHACYPSRGRRFGGDLHLRRWNVTETLKHGFGAPIEEMEKTQR